MKTSKTITIDRFAPMILPCKLELVSWSLDDVPASLIIGEAGKGKSRVVRQLDIHDAAHDQVRP